MSYERILVRGAAVLASVLIAAGDARSGTTKTITVNCAKAESVNQALSRQADELVIEIRGLCHENVRVLRDNVTLRGADPEVDGISAVPVTPPGPPLPVYAALEVRGSNVVLENLKFTNGVSYGLLTVYSNGMVIRNCRMVGNAEIGAHFTASSFATVENSVFSGNGNGGARVQRGSLVVFGACTFRDNPTPGAGIALTAGWDGRVSVDSSLLAGSRGLLASRGAQADLYNSSVEAATWAVDITTLGANVDLTDVTLNGSIRLNSKGLLNLSGVTQTASPMGENRVRLDSTLAVEDSGAGASTLLGPTLVEAFAQLVILGTSTHTGNVVCSSGGDAFCQNPTNVTGTVTGCARCIKP